MQIYSKWPPNEDSESIILLLYHVIGEANHVKFHYIVIRELPTKNIMAYMV